jgi:hypothetical protein
VAKKIKPDGRGGGRTVPPAQDFAFALSKILQTPSSLEEHPTTLARRQRYNKTRSLTAMAGGKLGVVDRATLGTVGYKVSRFLVKNTDRSIP